jgi:hypothetical protein
MIDPEKDPGTEKTTEEQIQARIGALIAHYQACKKVAGLYPPPHSRSQSNVEKYFPIALNNRGPS